MKLVTDIDEIKKLAREKEEEDYGFRSFLKSGLISPKKIDLITQKIYKEVAEQIDCTKCANCCKEKAIVINEEDIRRFREKLGMSRRKFEEKYLVKNQDDKYIFNKSPCPFLKDDLCTIYDFRPEYCQSFPHILKKSLVPQAIRVIKNTSVCPIVFNLYEELKQEIWAMNDDFDDIEDEFL
jgi:Fe-S-cluster containining protein